MHKVLLLRQENETSARRRTAKGAPVSSPRSGMHAFSSHPTHYYRRFRVCVLRVQLCSSKVSCAMRLNASAATVLSRRGAVMPHSHTEQHHPVKSSASIQIKRLCMHLPFGGFRREGTIPLTCEKRNGKNGGGTVAARRKQSPMRLWQMQSNWSGLGRESITAAVGRRLIIDQSAPMNLA